MGGGNSTPAEESAIAKSRRQGTPAMLDGNKEGGVAGVGTGGVERRWERTGLLWPWRGPGLPTAGCKRNHRRRLTSVFKGLLGPPWRGCSEGRVGAGSPAGDALMTRERGGGLPTSLLAQLLSVGWERGR